MIQGDDSDDDVRDIGRSKAADATATVFGRIMAKNNIRCEMGRCIEC